MQYRLSNFITNTLQRRITSRLRRPSHIVSFLSLLPYIGKRDLKRVCWDLWKDLVLYFVHLLLLLLPHASSPTISNTYPIPLCRRSARRRRLCVVHARKGRLEDGTAKIVRGGMGKVFEPVCRREGVCVCNKGR